MEETMQNTIAETHQGKNNQSSAIQSGNWPPAAFSALSAITKTSNQVMQKNPDGSLYGVRYVVMPDPVNLRPIRSWTINIEQWACTNIVDIQAKDVLSITILNKTGDDAIGYIDVVNDVKILDHKVKIDSHNSFNAVMAAIVFISKIDAGRIPDIDKTLSIYNLID
jgi:hypothetical protein